MACDARTFFTYPTAFGPVTIGADGTSVTAIVLGEAALPGKRRPSAVSNRCATEIMEYLSGKRTAFTVPWAAAGTPFQKDAWEAVARIPYGQVRTTRELAGALGAPESFRTVGAAVRKSPLALIIPTHRIVTAAGKPVSPVATALLNLERQNAR